MKYFLLLLSLLAAPAWADEIKLKPLSMTYTVEWDGIALGDALITLVPEGGADCYRYTSQTQPVALVRWLYGTPHETSSFCIRNGVIRPVRFEYVVEKREKDNFSLDFDWNKRKVRGLKRGNLTERDLPETAYDRFILQQAVKLWVMGLPAGAKNPSAEFNMVDDDRIVPYRFEVKGAQTMQGEQGAVQTLLVERTDNPNKSLKIWMMPDRQYSAYKIEQIEDGKVKLRMSLK